MAKRTRWAIFVGFSLIALFGVGLLQQARLSIQQYRLDKRLSELNARREQLLATRQRLESDPVYIEGLIRKTFKYTQPGESVIPLDPALSKDPLSTTDKKP